MAEEKGVGSAASVLSANVDDEKMMKEAHQKAVLCWELAGGNKNGKQVEFRCNLGSSVSIIYSLCTSIHSPAASVVLTVLPASDRRGVGGGRVFIYLSVFYRLYCLLGWFFCRILAKLEVTLCETTHPASRILPPVNLL